MGRKLFSPEKIIVKLREAEVIESKDLALSAAASHMWDAKVRK